MQNTGRLQCGLATAALVWLAFNGVMCCGAPTETGRSGSRLAPSVWSRGLQRLTAEAGFTGFLDARFGLRTQNDAEANEDLILGELRLQLEHERELGPAYLAVTADLLYDRVGHTHDIHLERGAGWLDLREASLLFTPVIWSDVKVGRQVLTWGTGDLLFINDLFSKDWNAFFVGRDEECMKAPSDALRLSLFHDLASLDLVYTPRFDANRFPDNRRLSFWNPIMSQRVGEDASSRFERPDNWLDDHEIAARLFRTVRGYELALYWYYGFWKDPKGFDPGAGVATFPDLTVAGASARGTLGRGIANLELGYYDSRNDRSGEDPFVPNSQFRLLAGYEQEIGRDFTAGLQYYLEFMRKHGAYLHRLPAASPEADEDRHVITLRLTKALLRQNLILSAFAYFSPADLDAYLRPNVLYKVNDNVSVTAGANVFMGKYSHTFFGQFDRNTNVYAGVRCAF